MYCSRCAAPIGEDLNFCSTCGERVNKNEAVSEKKVRSDVLNTVAAIAILLGIGGMLCLVGLVAVLLDRTLPVEVIVLIAAMYLIAWFGIMYKIVNQLTKVVDANLEERKARPGEAATFPVELPPRVTAQLEAQKHEPASVTEQTTRGLEPVRVRDR